MFWNYSKRKNMSFSASKFRTQANIIKSKRKRKKEDRLSSLPDEIIHRILSFVDAVSAVQTSVLSKRWMNVWTSLPVLNFHSSSFDHPLFLHSFINHFMSHRDASTNLYALNFTCNDDLDDSEIVDSLIDHVTLSPTIQLLSIAAECPVTKLPQLSLCHSLTTLRLDDIATEATGFEFVSLQCFHLFDCRFECGSGDTLDLFRGCINLQDLCLQDCVYYGRVKRFKISAPHLVHLSVSGMRVDEEFDSDCIIELFTPKLQTFTYSDSHVYKFSVKVNLSLLQKVNIVLDYLTTDMDANLSLRLFELFEVVGSAKSVFLSPVVIKVLSMFPNLMKGRPCPFSRVTIFKLITDGPLYSYLIPTNVMTYLFGGSPEMRRIKRYFSRV